MCRARDAITGSRLSQQQRRGSNFLNFLNFRGIRNGGMFAGAGRDWPAGAAADDLRFADGDAGTTRSLVPRDDTSWVTAGLPGYSFARKPCSQLWRFAA
jgi:hypothetical protein